MARSRSAWWPGGRTAQKALSHSPVRTRSTASRCLVAAAPHVGEVRGRVGEQQLGLPGGPRLVQRQLVQEPALREALVEHAQPLGPLGMPRAGIVLDAGGMEDEAGARHVAPS
jgi:hypothetical protein